MINRNNKLNELTNKEIVAMSNRTKNLTLNLSKNHKQHKSVQSFRVLTPLLEASKSTLNISEQYNEFNEEPDMVKKTKFRLGKLDTNESTESKSDLKSKKKSTRVNNNSQTPTKEFLTKGKENFKQNDLKKNKKSNHDESEFIEERDIKSVAESLSDNEEKIHLPLIKKRATFFDKNIHHKNSITPKKMSYFDNRFDGKKNYKDDDDDDEFNYYESYEAFIQRQQMKKQRKASAHTDPVWSSEFYEKPETESNPLNLRFGSSLSEDANYAMLKTYEDMLYQDLATIYPSTYLTRNNTQLFMNLPSKLQSNQSVKLPQISPRKNKKHDKGDLFDNGDDSEEAKSHKYAVSQHLEKAMKISDVIKRKKGELTTTDPNVRINNLVTAYENWKTKWPSVSPNHET